MKKKYIGFLGLSLAVAGTFVAIDNYKDSFETSEFSPRESASQIGSLANGAIEMKQKLYANVNTGKIEAEDFTSAFNAYKSLPKSRASNMQFIEEGPDNVGGRTRAILIDRNDKNIIYAGSVSGGLFKSTDRANTWFRVDGFNENLAISSIVQTLDGYIYVGTGSTFEDIVTQGESGGHASAGVYVSTDNGTSFQTIPNMPSNWVGTPINEMVVVPNTNKIFIVADNPVRLATYDPVNEFNIYSVADIPQLSSPQDIKISPDGNVLVFGGTTGTWVSTDAGTTYTKVSGNSAGQIPSRRRTEYAISHEKNGSGNYTIYALTCQSQGQLGGVFMSEDNGLNWIEIIPPTTSTTSPSFDPFSVADQFQGIYDMIATVVPGHPDWLIMGGIDLYLWKKSNNSNIGQVAQLSFGLMPSFLPQYAHSDQHALAWDEDNRLYIGNDGGVGISLNATLGTGIEFYPANRGYNVTQFFSVTYNGYGDVMGGTQDNGTQLNQHTGGTDLEFFSVQGGDGFDCDLSGLSRDAWISSIYTGITLRTANAGQTSNAITSQEMAALPIYDFYTELRMIDFRNDQNSTDSLLYVYDKDDTLVAGDTLNYGSQNLNFPLQTILTDSLIDGDSLILHDPVQTLCAFGGIGQIWVTREVMRLGKTPTWWKVLGSENGFSGNLRSIEFSKDGGNTLFVGTWEGDLYRVSGFNNVYFNSRAKDTVRSFTYQVGTDDAFEITYDSVSYNYADVRSGQQQLDVLKIYDGTSQQAVTGIAVDPNNPDHVVITLGGYGATSNIRRSTTATTATDALSFSSIDNRAVKTPAFDAVINKSNSSEIIVGTAFGMWATDNLGSTWDAQNDEMGIVPVYAVRQQWRDEDHVYVTNPGVIYVGTHGRGIWRADNFSEFTSIEETVDVESKLNLVVYPNPVQNVLTVESDFDQNNTITIYSINGELMNRVSSNKSLTKINVQDYSNGTYIVSLENNGKISTSRFIKR